MSEPISDWVIGESTPGVAGSTTCVVDSTFAETLETPHTETFRVRLRKYAHGSEQFTRDIPGLSGAQQAALDEGGLVRVGAEIRGGDILVGKVVPRPTPRAESAEEKLLRSIFREGGPLDASLRAPQEISGRVTKALLGDALDPEAQHAERIAQVDVSWTRPLEVGDVLSDAQGRRAVVASIRELDVDLQWPETAGKVKVAKVRIARDALQVRSIGPYSRRTEQPLGGTHPAGGRTLHAGFIAGLVREGAVWSAWEMLGLKSDAEGGERPRAWEALVRGEFPASVGRRLVSMSSRSGTLLLRALAFDVDWVSPSPGLRKTAGPAARLRLASPDRIRSWSHGEVKKPETLNYRTSKPEPQGLFCARVFGPLRDDECSCGKYKRMRHRGIRCEKCGVEVIPAKARRERLGHIELVTPVAHIGLLDNDRNPMGEPLGVTRSDLLKVLYCESYMVSHRGSTRLREHQVLTEEQYREALESFGADAFKVGMGGAVIRDALSRQGRGSDVRGIDIRPEWMLLEVIPVLPPGLRPMRRSKTGTWISTDLNDLYRRVINRNNRLRRLQELLAPDIIIRNETRLLQEAVDALFGNGRGRRTLTTTSSDKRPLVPLSTLLGAQLDAAALLRKTVDYSGSLQLVPDPQVAQDVCRLPLEAASELFRPFAYSLLCERGHASTVKRAKAMVDEGHPEAARAVRDVASSWVVLLTSESAWTACRVVVGEGVALAVAPDLAAELGAESAQIHVPITLHAVHEVRARLGRVAAIQDYEPERTGWLSALFGGADPMDTLPSIEVIDRATDPVLRVAMGWSPSLPRESWLSTELVGPLGEDDPESSKAEDGPDIPITDLELSVRTRNCLDNAGIVSVHQLLSMRDADLLKLRNFGRKSLNELREVVGALGFTLGMLSGDPE